MRAHSFLIAAAVVVLAACGDDSKLTPDAQDIDAPASTSKCSDGIDNDGDGLIDFPADPGCTAPQQDDEMDDCPSGPHCPQCKNGIDDDGNGSTDFPDDPGCSSASDTTEFINNPVACGAGLMVMSLPATGTATGTLDGTSFSQVTSTCGGGQGVPALAYQISLTAPKVMVASTAGSTVDTILELRGATCETDDIECSGDISSSDRTSKITRSLAAGNYYLIVSGNDSASVGDFALDVRFFAGEGETCTDTSQCGAGLVCRVPSGQTAKVCAQPMCNDGVDDDGDGKNDYPTDPGCANAADNDETDPNPLPACSNGTDDDGDGMTDYPADTSCTSAAGGSEACQGEEDPVDTITSGTTTGTTIGSHDNHQPTCVGASSDGGDLLYTLTVPATRSLVLDTEGTTANTVVSLMRDVCTEPGLGCDNDSGTSSGASRLQLTNLAAGTYVVAVDQYTGTSSAPQGAFNLHVSGVLQQGSSCDATSTLGGALACPAANPCGAGPGGTMICLPSICNDGIDNDGDGKMDFPADPGCASIDDTDESDSCPGVGPNCPECADGVDNDGDGMTDFPDDSSCAAPGGASEGCPTTDGLTAITMPVTQDTNVGANDDVHPTCTSSGSTAGDKTYSLALPPLRNLSITDESDADLVLVLYGSTCGGTALACSDPEDIERTNVPAGNYFLVVDGWSTAQEDSYTINVHGQIQNGASCESPLADSGALVCGPGFACSGAAGSRTCRPAGCNDGIDNDGDGKADYPNDPGCASPGDSDETDNCPGGAGCPACSDGMDNDGDLLIDYPNDPSCVAASGTTEACDTSEGVTPLVLPMTSGNTAPLANDDSPACTSTANTSPDQLYSLDLPAVTSLTIAADTTFDAVVSMYGATCGGTPLGCSDSPESLSFGALTAGTYYFSVDGYGSNESGSYTLSVSGRIAGGASCEGALAASGALQCAPGFSCKGTTGSRTCQPALCADGIDNDGDGKIDYPSDPGCDSAGDDDEADPATAPVCSNGLDDDTDNATDYPADFGCSSAAGASEAFCVADTDPPLMLTTTPVTATTMGLTNDFTSSSCQSNSNGADVAYSLQLPVPVDTLVLDLSNSTFDTVLTLRDTACTELFCNDDGGTPFGRSKLTLHDVAAGNYALVVDGYSSNSGSYTLAVTGTVLPGTSCSSPLFASGVLACPTGTTCNSTSMTCQ